MSPTIRDPRTTSAPLAPGPLPPDALQPATPMPLRPNAPFDGLFEPPWYENEIRGEKKLPWGIALPFVLAVSLAFWWGILKLVMLAIA